MAWLRIEDAVTEHRKHLQAGPAACWLWVCGIAYCQRQLSDGFIPKEALPVIGISQGVTRLAARLVSVGLFDAVEGGFLVHDYHDYNDTREEAHQRRADLGAVRAKAGRLGGLRSAQTRQAKHEATPQQQGQQLAEANRSPIPSLPIPSLPEERERARSVFAGSLPRDHIRHSWCSARGKCVPDWLHAEFCRAVDAENLPAASVRLKMFYEATEHGWPVGAIGDEAVKLWKAEFAAKFPRIAPIAKAQSFGPTAEEILAAKAARR